MVGDTCASEQAMATIVGRGKRGHVCGDGDGFCLALEIAGKLPQSDEGAR